jgi:hypothetical protein
MDPSCVNCNPEPRQSRLSAASPAIIERIGLSARYRSWERLHAAGQATNGQSFEEVVLNRLDAISRDVREVKTAASGKQPTD